MCTWGTTTRVWVKVQARLSSTGQDRWKHAAIDSCIADLVQALSVSGIDMVASCCGHGKCPGRIDLADGRILTIDGRVA